MNPYKTASDRSFWSRSVSRKYNPSALLKINRPLIRPGERVATAGSCFAANLIPYLEESGFHYIRKERPHTSLFMAPPENLGYGQFSAAYGNIYTARQLLQLLLRSVSRFTPVEDRWTTEDGIIDPFRPGLRYKALSNLEFDLLTTQHLRAVREVFCEADVFIFTLGLTEAWVSCHDGAVFPACPGTVAGEFDRQKHLFHNFTVNEVVSDLMEFVREIQAMNSEVRVILTVSPVPLVATATENHVLAASIYSKSVLRAAAEEVAQCFDRVTYFPAYEIVTGPQAPESFFEADRRNVSQVAVKEVMSAFLAQCDCVASDAATDYPNSSRGGVAAELSKLIAEAECEELMADRP